MNEVKHIHIGRQQFTVSVEAYSELKNYLEAIKKKVGESGADVVEEVELRMAELLTARGITTEKVIVLKDVKFLKSQLGEPSDFSESDEPAPKGSKPEEETTKRLFRDTDGAMIAGVAAGLARYFGIDATIIRLLFIGFTLIGGSGILVYLLLWLLVPEAKTTSDRLSMQGKPATIDNLKQVVERADLPGAAKRGGSIAAKVLAVAGKVLLFIIGLPLAIAGGLGLLGTIAMSIYLLLNGMRVGGQVVAPIGSHEVVGFIAGVVTAMTILLLLLFIGIAMMRRRWQLPAWGVAAIVGVFFLAASIGGALAADVVPTIQNRVQALHHTKTVQVDAFTQAVVTGDDLNVSYIPDSETFVRYSFYGSLPINEVRTSVSSGTLYIAASNVAKGDCNSFCTDIQPGLTVEIHAPKLTSLTLNGSTFTGENSRLGEPEPVFFGWHPDVPKRGIIEYNVSSD
jgi:phage shock protein PspC (stress-responsive transcriptional regulator)